MKFWLGTLAVCAVLSVGDMADAQPRGGAMSDVEMLTASDRILVDIDGIAAAVTKLRDDAAGEEGRQRCISDKLTRVRAYGASAAESKDDLASAVDTGDSAAAAHHFGLVELALARSKDMLAQAQACTGEEARFTGETQREFNGPDDDEDPTDLDDDTPGDRPDQVGPPPKSTAR